MAVNNIADPEAKVPTKPKGGRKKMFLVLVIVLVLAAGAAAAKFLLFTPKKGSEAAVKRPKMETMALDSIVVNLADKDAAHYLRVTIVLAYVGDEKFAKELEEHKFLLTDGIIQLLRKKTNAEVTAPDAAETLKRELIHEINSHLKGKAISDIYLSEYLVQ
ncbi:MAG: hypothetical protein C4570_04210 [Ammonifex sp.]|jgi:flagellar basal body-associated protein FliL|nr:MAG: hypothetical protein C4570_04210 [Ammonifex sp.]